MSPKVTHLDKARKAVDDYIEDSASPLSATTATVDVALESGMPVDSSAEIQRLATLTPVEYDRQRAGAATAIGCRIATLDAEVRRLRGDADDTGGQGQALAWPDVDPHPDPVDGAELLDDLVATIRTYIVLPEHAAEACALWAVMTWLVDVLDLLPLLRILSPTKMCGKTTLLDVLTEISRRPMPASGISPAALFRVIEAHGPTLLLDEVDTFLKESEDHRGILNAGHSRAAAKVIRTVGDDHEPRAFSVFGPKVLAGIGTLPGTIEDRAIRIELRRRAPGETIGSLRRDGRDQFDVLRRKIVRWTDDHRAAIRSRVADVPMPAALSDRAADNWSPLSAIAEAASPEWAAIARAAAVALTVTDDVEERAVLLLGDVRDVFNARGAAVIGTADLLAALTAMEDRPWTDYRHGRPITAHQLAARLRGFGVRPRDVRLSPTKNSKGYRFSDLADPIARYLPPGDPRHRDNADMARVSSPIGSATGWATVADRNTPEPTGDAGCRGVADQQAVGWEET